jgi:serine/threonine protein kinase
MVILIKYYYNKQNIYFVNHKKVMVYKLGRILGKGSDGIVYELLDGENNDKVIKFMQGGDFGIKNYIEYYILFQLNSRYLTKASDMEIEEDGLIKIVQPKAKMDLKDYIFKNSLKMREKKKIMADLLRGVKFLHSRKLIHGDIKPSNILVFDDGIKFTDFNLSILERSRRRIRNLYTITYRPPEISCGKVTLKSDIWALGCTFFEIYYGYPYFNFRKEKEFIHLKSTREHDPDNKIFNILISSMMEKNDDDRHSVDQVMKNEFFEGFHFEKVEEAGDFVFDIDYFCKDSEKDKKILRYKLGMEEEKPRYNKGFRKIEKRIIENKFLFFSL